MGVRTSVHNIYPPFSTIPVNESSLPIRKIVLFFALLALVAIAAAETNYIQIFVHPGSGNVCLDNTCQVDRGTLAGYSGSKV